MNRNFLKFLSNRNGIIVRNRNDYNRLIDLLKSYKLEWILGNSRNRNLSFDYWFHLAEFNKVNVGNGFIFEFDVYKGIAFGDSIERSIDWFGVPPIYLDELE